MKERSLYGILCFLKKSIRSLITYYRLSTVLLIKGSSKCASISERTVSAILIISDNALYYIIHKPMNPQCG